MCYNEKNDLNLNDAKRCKDERDKTYRYVKVIFNPFSSGAYSYIDEERTACKNDFVLVPVGSANESKFAQVVSVKDYCAADAPYPVERTKRIIRLATKEEAESCDESW